MRIPIAVLLALALLAPGASAATRVGDYCVANAAEGTYTLVPEQVSGPTSLPLEAPTGGILTSWSVTSEVGPVSERMGVFQLRGIQEFRLVAESDQQTVVPGGNTFPARIPVESGSRFGVVGVGPGSPAYCATGESEDHTPSFPGTQELGSTEKFAAGVSVRVPLVVSIEPDADNDGYGDETQDGCPQSAAFTGPCPGLVTLSVKRKVRKRSILLEVTPSGPATVDVYGQVGWNFKPPRPKTKRRRHMAQASRKSRHRLIIGLDGGTKGVAPGTVTKFTVKLPKSVLRRRGRLTRRESVRAHLTLRATNPLGLFQNTRLRVPLRGFRKP